MFIRESDEKYLKDVLDMYSENKPAIKRNETFLNEFPCEPYTTGSNYKISKGTNYKISININNVNICIQDSLINGQKGTIRNIEFSQVSVLKVYICTTFR